MSFARAVAVGVALCLLPVTARADSAKAWAAAKAGLPAKTNFVVGMDVAALTKLSLFKMAFPLLLSQKPDVKATLEVIKTTCKIDVLATVEGLVAGTDEAQKEGALYLQVKGIDDKALTSCVQAIAKSTGSTVSVTVDAGITEITVGKDKVFLTWVTKDVVVVSLESDKTQLQAWIGGKKAFAKSPAGLLAAKIDTKATIFAATAVGREIEGTKMKMKGGYGGLTSAKGNLAIDLHLLLPSAADAKTLADKASAELTGKINEPGLAPALKPVLESVTIKNASTEVVVKANVAEGQVLSIVGALMN